MRPSAPTGEEIGLRKLIPYLPAIVWAACVLGIGSLHSIPTPDVSFQIDKVGHFAMYALLGGLAALGWSKSRQFPHFAIVLVVAMCVGIADEVHQRYVAGRTSDARDFAADAAGVLIGFTFAARIYASHHSGTE